MTNRPDYAWEIKAALTDARKLCEGLGIDLRGAKPNGRHGLIVRCPAHQERSPSCSIRPAGDHTLQARCFGCDFTGDALTLVALVHQLPRSAFREILAEGARIAGLHGIVAELRDGRVAADRPAPKQLPPPEPPRPYLPEEAVRDVWTRGERVDEDRQACSYLVCRRLDPLGVSEHALARILAAPAPEWATYGRRSWLETGHRMIFRVFDAWGTARGIRACRLIDGDSPKRLPASGYRAGELVLANRIAWGMLRGDAPPQILIAEGETDWLALSLENPKLAVIGIGSGSWTQNFADAIPADADIYVYTDNDEAGDRYATQIIDSLGEKCRTFRGVAA